MKKAILIVLCMTGLTASAQKGERGNHRGPEDFTPEQVATLQTKKMTLALDLTQDQQTKIQALHAEKAKQRKARMEERKAQKESGELKKPTAEERYNMRNARLDEMLAHKTEMKNLLSPEQYQKWEKMVARKGKHTRKKGEGRKMHKRSRRG